MKFMRKKDQELEDLLEKSRQLQVGRRQRQRKDWSGVGSSLLDRRKVW